MKVVAENRRARFDYDVTETLEAGIVLTGQEVKAVRSRQANLAGSYVTFLGGVPMIRGMAIAPYRFASGVESYNPRRDRTLLLKQRDIDRFASSQAEKGITIIPLEVHADAFIKVLLGIARGRKKHDKRTVIRERDIARRMRAL